MDLNKQQIEAVNCTEGPLLILAGAGSGKTTVLINRIYHLIHDKSISPYNILAITFTNKAADELKNRLEAKLGEEALDIWACTFHSSCVRILRRDADKIGFDKNFSIYDVSDCNSLVKHILKDFNIDEKFFPPKTILNEISIAKEAMILPDDFLRYAKINNDLHKIKLAEIYKEYMSRMQRSNSMDFDDLLLFTVMLLNNNPDVRSYWVNRFKYILIDEYQDTNKLQYEFASLLTGPDENICVVGDDDQSIYKFRGANIENILNFEKQFKNCTVIRLEQNYRSTGNILDAANNVISNNSERKGKTLWTNNDRGDKVQFYTAENQDEEANYVCSIILDGIVHGNNWRDYAVLYRKNVLSNSLEYALKRNSIPYRIIGGMKFFERAEVKDILSYMQVVNTPEDDLRLERIINTPARGIGAKTLESALQIASANGLSLYSVISNCDNYPELSKASNKLKDFVSLINSLIEFAKVNTSDCVYDEIIEKTEYVKILESKNTIEDTARAENVKELKSSIITFINSSGDDSLEGYLANIALYNDLDNYDDSNNAVTLMTIHSSKGLEYPTVFVVGMEETVFPGMSSIIDQSELEEERRLCYVAITRAKDNLYLTSAKYRMLYGKTNANRVSRFIDEIPDDYIVKTIPRGYRYSDSSYSQNSYSQPSSFNNTISYISSSSSTTDQIKLSPAKSSSIHLEQGDRIKHKVFGIGTVIKKTQMDKVGEEYLIEVDFEKTGTKKMMLKAVAKFIEKI